jgi:hypothetical protein
MESYPTHSLALTRSWNVQLAKVPFTPCSRVLTLQCPVLKDTTGASASFIINSFQASRTTATLSGSPTSVFVRSERRRQRKQSSPILANASMNVCNRDNNKNSFVIIQETDKEILLSVRWARVGHKFLELDGGGLGLGWGCCVHRKNERELVERFLWIIG